MRSNNKTQQALNEFSIFQGIVNVSWTKCSHCSGLDKFNSASRSAIDCNASYSEMREKRGERPYHETNQPALNSSSRSFIIIDVAIFTWLN